MPLLVAIVIGVLLARSLCAQPECQRLAVVKYRATPVCLDAMQYADTSKSSWIRGAWYDVKNAYLVISSNGTLYHYCRVPDGVWTGLQGAASHGKYFNANIKGRFDCRLGGPP